MSQRNGIPDRFPLPRACDSWQAICHSKDRISSEAFTPADTKIPDKHVQRHGVLDRFPTLKDSTSGRASVTNKSRICDKLSYRLGRKYQESENHDSVHSVSCMDIRYQGKCWNYGRQSAWSKCGGEYLESIGVAITSEDQCLLYTHTHIYIYIIYNMNSVEPMVTLVEAVRPSEHTVAIQHDLPSCGKFFSSGRF